MKRVLLWLTGLGFYMGSIWRHGLGALTVSRLADVSRACVASGMGKTSSW